uniref:Calcium/calmodulin-dependent protein kinase II association-domain domain-containing protein n=1 Tax=Fibrocapsa japonica TaxID=94617 RepID=A0A7S2Y1I1_9STRA|mmetsp:Transcript_8442/g.12884  ORF Transcript_8442/g.12884 Transcript_8442/m.12884 type:complete len:595 (+) Transcript_8442:94-1878(+)
MKFTLVVATAALFAGASAFVPSQIQGPQSLNVNRAFTNKDVVRTTTQLDIFKRIGGDQKAEGETITEKEVRSLFSLWNSALATGDSRIVASRYSSSPVLLPTVSDTPRTNFDTVKDYFDAFLLKEPQGKILDGHITIGDGWASDSGIYEFTMGATGDKVKARYSYIYVQEDGIWKIQHHHSSVMPEEVIMGKAITEDEVKGLFHLWNDALATLDPKKVAMRYAKKGVLLPTVSDTPRTDFASIEDYFVNFLKLKPQGEILESNVVVGHNWAQDCGIYEFTMGATGKKVKGRYSFIYVYEGGEWKISHHHSSVMPEGIVTAEPITEEEVKGLFNLWNDALATKDPFEVANRYAKYGVLLPTVSDVPRTEYPGIVDYFTNFLKLEPQGEILESNVIVGTNWAQDAGIYEFTMGATGAKVKGRYTFVYIYENGEWKISQHHSSVMPEGTKPVEITEEEVKNLFQLWNMALATEDPDAVASRYAKKAVLLPTVSDVPRTDYDLIRHYFVGFLKNKPQGEILESNVVIGHNWCQDAGIYEFTMGATGDKVKGRYSFVYVWEDGQWKISHHHSSVMPEAILGPAPKPNEVAADAKLLVEA